jgi:hypothetical protein
MTTSHPYVYVYFMPKSDYDKLVPMQITPAPQTIIRDMLFKTLDEPIKVVPQTFTARAIFAPDLLSSTFILTGPSSRVKPRAQRRTASRLRGLTRSASRCFGCHVFDATPCRSNPRLLRRRRCRTNQETTAQPLAPLASPLLKSVMHAASSLHDLQTLPRNQNPGALPPIFVLRDIYTVGAFVPQPTGMLYSPHMAPRKQTKKRKATLDSVLSTVERGFAAVADDITDIKSKMATKGDINRLDTTLTKFEENEIDKRLQLEVRVSHIEKHLGLDKKIVA